MKQTNNAIKFLLAQYRAIFRHAYLKGLVAAAVLTTGLSVGAGANAETLTGAYTYDNEQLGYFNGEQQLSGEGVTVGSDKGVTLSGDHTLNNFSITINADDPVGTGARLGFNSGEGSGSITVIGTNNLGEQVTIHSQTDFASGEATKGSINVAGYLTVSLGASGSNLAGADIVIKPLNSGDSAGYGDLTIDPSITVGNLTFASPSNGKSTDIDLYADVGDKNATISGANFGARVITVSGNGQITFASGDHFIKSSILQANLDDDANDGDDTPSLVFSGGSSACVVNDGNLGLQQPLTVSGGIVFTNNGTLTTVSGSGDTSTSGQRIAKKGDLTIGDKSTFTNVGSLEIGEGTTFTVASGATFEVEEGSTFTNNGSIALSGSVSVKTDLTLSGNVASTSTATVNVAKAKTLTVDEALLGDKKLLGGNVSGSGTLSVTASSVVDLSTYTNAFSAEDGTFGTNLTISNINFDKVNFGAKFADANTKVTANSVVIGDKFTVSSGANLTVSDFEFKGVTSGTVTVDNTGASSPAYSQLNLQGTLSNDKLSLASNADGAQLNVQSGAAWTVGKVTISGGSLSIAADAALTTGALTSSAESDTVKIAGDLSVTGDGKNTTADFDVNVESGAAFNGVLAGGTLNLNKIDDTLGGVSFSGTTVTLTNAADTQVFVENGGKVVIDLADIEGIGANGITVDQFNALKAQLFASGSSGLLELASGSIDVDLGDFEKDQDGNYTYNDVKDVITNSDAFQDQGIAIDSTTAASGVAGTVGNLVVSDGNATTSVKVSAEGLKTGNDGLIASYEDAQGEQKAVGLDLGTDGQLTTYGDNAVAGDITGSGEVTVSKNFTVVAKGEGFDSTNYGDFEAATVTLAADGALTAQDVTLNKASGLNQGTINAHGNVTLANSDGVTLAGMNINAGSGSVTVSDDFSMTKGYIETTGTVILNGTTNQITGGSLSAQSITGTLVIGNPPASAPVAYALAKLSEPAPLANDANASRVIVKVGQLQNSVLPVSKDGVLAVGQDLVTATDYEVAASVDYAISQFTAPEEVTSVVYFKDGAHNLANTASGIYVGTSASSNSANANVFAVDTGSLTIIDGATISATSAALSGDAKVYVSNVQKGDTILSGGLTVTGTEAWQGENAIVANKFLMLSGVNTGSNAVTVVENTEAAKAYNLLTAEEFAYVKEVALTDGTSSLDTGDYFVSDIFNGFNGDTYAQQSAFTSVGRIAQMAGVETIAMNTINTSSTAILQRLGIASVESTQISSTNPSNGASLWLAPTYTSIDASGFDAGAFGYGADIDMTGLALGFDTLTNSGVRLGAMFNIGSGDSDSQDTYISTTNDFDFFGFGIYAGAKLGDFDLVADAGYHFISNDVEQNNIEKLKADIDSTAVTVGVNGQYTFNLGMVSVAPHVGVRFNRINVDGYDVKANGHTVLTADDETLNVVQFPVGVTVASDITAGDFVIKPSFDLTITPAAGDTDADTDVVWISDFDSAAYGYTTEVFDSVSYSATAGISASMGDYSFGLGLNYTGSSNTNAYGVNAKVRFVF